MDNDPSHDTLNDRLLEREIEQALAVDLSPGFYARLRMRVGEGPPPRRWGLPWMLLIAASTVTLIMLLIRGDVPETTSLGINPIPITATPVTAPLVGVPVGRMSGLLRAAHLTGLHRTEPGVMLAREESEALRHLMRGLAGQGAGNPSMLKDAAAIAAAIRPLDDIVLAPLELPPPIAIEPVGFGAGQEGVYR